MPAVNIRACLSELARLYGVQMVYEDVAHRRRVASPEALLEVLKALGAPVASLSDVPSALRARCLELWRRVLEPVVVAWGGVCAEMRVCLSAATSGSLMAHLELESGERRTYKYEAADLPVLESKEVEGQNYVVRGLTLPEKMPFGYHRCILELSGALAETRLIAAPVKAYIPKGGGGWWGAFLPLYALHSQSSWGSGDFATLEALAGWVASLGGEAVATLPLLPAFLDKPFKPSPYAPVSRLVWNEFYLDIAGVPELAGCPPAQALLQSASFMTEIKRQRALPLVDYRRQMALKRRVLEELLRCLAGSPGRLADFRRFLRANPVVADYARFRAVMERRGTAWPSWPAPLRDGTLKDGDYDEAACRYHMYAQWLTHQRLGALAEKARSKGVALYFDLPLGVHAEGYDVWRERDVFALGASAGAPPDAVFTAGQDWKFPPLHPERLREQGYRYFIAYLRHHLQHAAILRLDHVMGLHRLFWIPQGVEASRGVYVRYRADEFYAILALESHRYRSLIVGEDLGMVPAYVRPAMAHHGLERLYVVNYELTTNPRQAMGRVPRRAVASLSTHDMYPFAAFWQGQDIRERLRLGLLDEKEARKEGMNRRAVKAALVAFLRQKGLLGDAASTHAVFESCLAYLCTSPARLVLVNLEDLWGETRPQNVPSTEDEYPNWRKKARYTFEEFCKIPGVVGTLKRVDGWRRQGLPAGR